MNLEELHGELQAAVVEANKSYKQLTKTRDLLEDMISNNSYHVLEPKDLEDAIFLARVWQHIRENGWQSVVDFGDVDGIDFVANRVLSSRPTMLAADLPKAAQKSEVQNKSAGG